MRAKAVCRVVDADHAGGVVEIVLGGVEQRAIGREHAVAEEMPAGDARRWSRGARVPGVVEDDGEGAGLAREDDRAAARPDRR